MFIYEQHVFIFPRRIMQNYREIKKNISKTLVDRASIISGRDRKNCFKNKTIYVENQLLIDGVSS